MERREEDVGRVEAGRIQAGDFCTQELAQEGTAWRVTLPGWLFCRDQDTDASMSEPAGPHVRRLQ